MERNGDLIVKVVPDHRRVTLQPLVTENVKPGGELHTDGVTSYAGLHTMGYVHKTVNHDAGEYVGFQGATMNSIEAFWRHLKCSSEGTHTAVSAKHLDRYVKEFEFRFNRRTRPASMFAALISEFPQGDEQGQ